MKEYQYIILIIAAVAILFLLVLIIRTLFEKNKAKDLRGARVRASEEELKDYVNKLGEMVRCKTIADENDSNAKEFEKFRNILRESFPLIHKYAKQKRFGDCLIYKIEGKNSEKNIMLMSHHDVVSGDGEWKYDPFLGELVDGVMWGRGTIDTKTSLFAEMQAVEELLEEGYDFQGINLYIGSSGNEEIAGDGIPLAVQDFKKEGIEFDVVLDEGGAIVSGMMPGVNKKSAMVAVHEKGRYEIIFKTSDVGKGHSGFKVIKRNPIERMSAFITQVKRTKISKVSFSREVTEMFKAHSPYMTFLFRLLFANMDVFKGLLLFILPLVSVEVEGMLKTTLSFTEIERKKQAQVKTKEVVSKLSLRCVRKEHLEKEIEKIKKIAEKHEVSMQLSTADYCQPSSANSTEYNLLKACLNEVFPDVIVSPYLLTAGTDARHFSDIAKSILRFAPIDLSKEQFKSVHGVNENIDVINIGECVKFYKTFIQRFSLSK